MKAIVMGCGGIGEQLSKLMLEGGHHVVVIDQNAEVLARLRAIGCEVARGVGFDRDVLLQAGIDDAEAFAATSHSDNANIVAARIARNLFHVPRVVARIQDPRKVEIYRRLGLITISPAHWGARRICELLSHANLAPIITLGNGEVSLLAIEAPPLLEGRVVRDLNVPGEVNVIALTREDMAILPTSGTEFRAGDLIHVAVLSGALERLEALLGLGIGG